MATARSARLTQRTIAGKVGSGILFALPVALLACHAAEIPYGFASHGAWLSRERAGDQLTGTMLAYWINFARVGDPNGIGLATWPALDETDARQPELGARIRPLPALDKLLCDPLAPRLYPEWPAPQPPLHSDLPRRNGRE